MNSVQAAAATLGLATREAGIPTFLISRFVLATFEVPIDSGGEDSDGGVYNTLFAYVEEGKTYGLNSEVDAKNVAGGGGFGHNLGILQPSCPKMV